jgi:hypothetical protein
MDKTNLQFYGKIEKFDAADDGTLMVSGIASTEAIDADGEVVTAEAMRKAIPSYLQCGTVREMHQPIAAGRPISAFVDDEGRTHFTAKIVDKNTVQKIREGVLKGFSIGGKLIKRVGNQITELLLKEISVVDLPNNPESFFSVVKFDKPNEHCNDKDCKTHTEISDEEKKKSEKTKLMEQEALKKLESITASQDSLAKTVADLVKTVETLSKAAPTIEKVQADLGDLQKRATETQAALVESEKSSVIAKMQSEGRVAYSDEGVAYKSDDLAKLDLPLLKVLAKNSTILPTEAKAIYKGEGKKNDFEGVRGLDLVEKSWTATYGTTLEEMKERASK